MPDDQSAALWDRAPGAPDLSGARYQIVLERLHEVLRPKTYLEVGVETGNTLALARCRSIGVDPEFQFIDLEIVRQIAAKPSVMLFKQDSDAFFAERDPTALLGGPIELAFLDGMHRCEYLLRDFINTERHCRRNAVVALHDCVPTETPMAERIRGAAAIDPRRRLMWTGDVWRVVVLLKRMRPDLHVTVLDASPTGLVLITNLDPTSTLLADGYAGFVRAMLTWSLERMTLAGLYAEIGLEPVSNLLLEEDISARFWL